MVACIRERRWLLFIAPGIGTFLVGVVLLLAVRALQYWGRSVVDTRRLRAYVSQQSSTYIRCARLRALSSALVSGSSTSSRALIVTMWLLNMASCLLFLIDATNFKVEECGGVRRDATQIIWLFLCFVFILYYILRFLAATDKLYMWVSMDSIVDHFTIVPAIIGLYLDTNWIGLRFLRLLHLLKLADVLQMVHLLRSPQRIRLVRVVFMFLTMWFTSSGFVHLSENNGDPHHNYENSQYMSYWQCVYWLLVTMSTVGFGDISPTTDIGKAFIVFFIMGSFAMFTSIIPELGRAMGHTSNYTKPYKRTYGKKHIVVCGQITYDSVTAFLRKLNNVDCDMKDTHVVFLSSQKPNLELSAFFHRNFLETTFFQGSALDSNALRHVKMDEAEACIVLADSSDSQPDIADTHNILRVTAVKNFCAHIRVIVQLLQHRSKKYLLHVPNWNWGESNSDNVVCISELKLAAMAQNCHAPGAATLLSNLLSNRSSPATSERQAWLENYEEGASNEIYAETFPRGFYGVPFQRAALVCFQQLNLVLVAVSGYEKKSKHLKLNPHDVIIQPGDVGFFIAQSQQEVRRISTIGLFDATSNAPPSANADLRMEPLPKSGVEPPWFLPSVSTDVVPNGEAGGKNNNSGPSHSATFDTSGLFHRCPRQLLSDVIIDEQMAHDLRFESHVIVTLSALPESASLGLANLVAPLRSSNIRYADLKDIVLLLRDTQFIRQKEWHELCHFPKLYVFVGDATNTEHLHVLRVTRCAMCVVLSACKPIQVDGKYTVDEDAILSALSVKYACEESPLRRLAASADHYSIEEFRSEIANSTESTFIVQLEIDSNIALLGSGGCEGGCPLYLHEWYAAGQVFASSCLDSLVSCTYINGEVLSLIRLLLIGSDVTDLEQVLADDCDNSLAKSRARLTETRDRCRLNQLSLVCGPLEQLQHKFLYGELFSQALLTYGILCLGLYRLINTKEMEPRLRRRYVITKPPPTLRLLPSDKVFVLQPFHLPVPAAADKLRGSHSQACLSGACTAACCLSRSHTSPLTLAGLPTSSPATSDSSLLQPCPCFSLSACQAAKTASD